METERSGNIVREGRSTLERECGEEMNIKWVVKAVESGFELILQALHSKQDGDFLNQYTKYLWLSVRTVTNFVAQSRVLNKVISLQC